MEWCPGWVCVPEVAVSTSDCSSGLAVLVDTFETAVDETCFAASFNFYAQYECYGK
jgi:hypothetical protein